ncbi:hypothetical protein BN940_07546 [Castellaniella defragrans 65Phen]|jgi:hypothetical protein|uniref:Uncharacterized protein n=1 Tax=Castellaniella defragrans (strain DSM 12143 / CCUG 39792 / 65Phen) TaxID=1437824 RepID=W8X903_CASD6|nr:hypothetical protein [Castellaniella defragrans]CDM23975.1 hypothetical protein BN940_07546 [Castellaniella defragrans 65Phen]
MTDARTADACTDLDDPLAALAPPGVQSQAADLARDAFTRAFRHAAAEPASFPLDTLRTQCLDWVRADAGADARAVRMALLLAGLDQWGLAFSQAFGIQAIPSLTALIGALRTGLDPAEDARFQHQFERLDAAEAAAIDFKIALRRQIHLALWHAMGAGASLEAVEPVIQTLGGQLLALDAGMPELGWRLVSDTLAHIQIRLLEDPDAPELAQSGTRCLFASLRQAWPKERHDRVMALAAQAVLAWQRGRRPPAG